MPEQHAEAEELMDGEDVGVSWHSNHEPEPPTTTTRDRTLHHDTIKAVIEAIASSNSPNTPSLSFSYENMASSIALVAATTTASIVSTITASMSSSAETTQAHMQTLPATVPSLYESVLSTRNIYVLLYCEYVLLLLLIAKGLYIYILKMYSCSFRTISTIFCATRQPH